MWFLNKWKIAIFGELLQFLKIRTLTTVDMLLGENSPFQCSDYFPLTTCLVLIYSLHICYCSEMRIYYMTCLFSGLSLSSASLNHELSLSGFNEALK